MEIDTYVPEVVSYIALPEVYNVAMKIHTDMQLEEMTVTQSGQN